MSKILGRIQGEGFICDIHEDADGRVHFIADADIDADGANGQGVNTPQALPFKSRDCRSCHCRLKTIGGRFPMD